MAQCRATCKATREQCRRRAVRGRAVCTVHGGLTPIGAAHPRATKGGRHSRHLVERLASRFEDTGTLPEPDSLRPECGLIVVRIGDLLRRIDTGESAAAWQDLRRIFAAMERKTARIADPKRRAAIEAEAVSRMADVMAKAQLPGGAGERETWADVFRLFDPRRKLAVAETRREVRERDTITATRLLDWLGMVLAIVRRHVTDRDALAAISAGFLALDDRPEPARTSTAGL